MSEEAGQTATGNVGAAVQAPSASASSASPAKKKRNGKGKSNGNGAAAVDANSRTIAITLPKEIIEWFELAASQAPFEPSVQKYVAWELRQIALAGQKRQSVAQSLLAGAAANGQTVGAVAE